MVDNKSQTNSLVSRLTITQQMKKITFIALIPVILWSCKKEEPHKNTNCGILSEISCEDPLSDSNLNIRVTDIDFNPTNSNQILYVLHRELLGIHELRIIDLTHCTDKKIFSDSYPINDIDWSYKQRIVFNRQGNVYTLDTKGNDLTKEPFLFGAMIPTITADTIYSATWSPDGTKLLCTGRADSGYRIWIKDMETKQMQISYPNVLLPQNYSWYAPNHVGFRFTNHPMLEAYRISTSTFEPVGLFGEAAQYFDYNTSNDELIWTPIFPFEGPKAIYSMNLQSGQSEQISADCINRNHTKVKISNDGKRIASICNYKTETSGWYLPNQRLVIMKSDGTEERVIQIPQ